MAQVYHALCFSMPVGYSEAVITERRIFYGWWVALAFSFIVFLSTGIRFTVGPFLKPVVADLDLDRGSFSLVISLSLFLYGAFMPLVGRLVDRFGSRLVVTTGTLTLAGALAATGTATMLWQLYLSYGILVAAGLAATGHVVASAILVRWFVRRRGAVVGLLSGASMAGMTFLVPVAMGFILTLGWRATYLLLGLFTLLLILPLSGGLFCCGFSMSLLSAHGVPMLTDHGFHPMTAAWALGLLGGSSVAGALGLGWLSDRLGRRPILASVYLVRALAFSMLFVVHDRITLMVVVAIGGLGMAGSLAMTSALTGISLAGFPWAPSSA